MTASVQVNDADRQSPTPWGVPLETSLRLTLVALLLRPMGPWFARPVLLALSVVMLCGPAWLRKPWAWGVLAGAIAVRIVDDWPLADNHVYLLGYWTFAVCLALRTARPGDALSLSSRALLALVFAFAVLWKGLLSPDYIDGRFFRVTLLTDPRFGEAARLIGGLSQAQLDASRDALLVLPEGAAAHDPRRVDEPRRLRWLATTSTWSVLVIEAAIPLLMLVPARWRHNWLRHVALLTFCAVTYLFAPVAGFGWLLLAMGMAQLDADQVALRRAYLATFLLVVFYDDVPWANLALVWLQ